MSSGTVQNLLSESPEYTPRNMSGKSRLTSDQIARYRAGSPAADLAEELGVSAGTVVRWLRKEGVQPRTKKEASVLMGEAKRIPLDPEELARLRAEGLSTREIGEKVGASEEVVRARMVAEGIPRLASKARPEKNAFWNGGLVVDKHGYILAKASDHPNRTQTGYVRLHRLVMERHLGRLLTSREVVDHLDGDTSDNRRQNLVLYPSNGEHLRATLTGRHAIADRLSREDRKEQRLAAVLRARRRVAAIHRERGTDARMSLLELDQWIDELATGGPTL